MKNIFTNTKLALLSLCMLLFTAASGQQTIVTTAADVTACPGNEVAVPITVENFNDVASISLTLEFSNSVLTYYDYQNTNNELSSGSLFVNEDNGKVILSWFALESINIGEGTLIEFVFIHNGGNTDLVWDTLTPGACEYSDDELNSLPAVFENGSVIDDCNLSISGIVTNGVTSTGIPGVNISFSNNGGIATTDQDGYYSHPVDEGWSGTATPSYESFTFTPEFREYDNVTSPQTEQDYTGIEMENLPPGWEFTITSTMHIISVPLLANPSIEDEPLETGDYIGVFFLDEDGDEICGGTAEWNGAENIPVIAYGDDNLTSEKDGFDENEPLIWKVYSWNDEMAYQAQVTYNQDLPNHDGTFVTNGLSALITLDAYETMQQSITLASGWSGLSSYLNPIDPNIENIFNPIVNDLVILQTMDKVYWPDQGINTIGTWDTQTGYKIKLNNQADFTINGTPLDNRSVTLDMGWSIIPVHSECIVSAFDVFNPLEDTLTIAKEIGGSRVFWPELEIYTLEELFSGKAYMISVTENTSITYPECTKSRKITKTLDSIFNTPWNNVTITGSSHTIGVEARALDSIYAGDVLGVFTNDGLCAGMTQIDDVGENQALTAFGDDSTTPEIDGFEENEAMTLKLYRPGTDEQFIVYPEFDENMPNTEFFSTNGLSKITDINLQPVGLADLEKYQFNIYPNPADDHITITTKELNVGIKFTLQNILGQPVKKGMIKRRQTQINTSVIHEGVYLLQFTSDNTTVTTKKIIIK